MIQNRPPVHETVNKLTQAEVLTTFLDPRNKDHLFPGNKIVIFWQPYDVIESNIKYFLHHYQTTVYSIQKGEICSSVGCISSCPVFRNLSGLRVDYEYYGDSLEEWKILFLQALKHILTLDYKGDVFLKLFYAATLERFSLASWIKETFGWDIGPFSWNKDEYQLFLKRGKVINKTVHAKL